MVYLKYWRNPGAPVLEKHTLTNYELYYFYNNLYLLLPHHRKASQALVVR